MIKLQKLPEPDVLATHGAAWLNTLKDKIAGGGVPTDSEKNKYRHPDIKAVLKAETHGKCAYCESYLLHIAYGDVEHVTPKSTDINETFRWANLTLACDVCNTNKGAASNLVDPYVDDPADFFKFLGPMIFPKFGNQRALLTEAKLKLNRIELIERRSERLNAVSKIILLISTMPDPELRETLRIDLETVELADDKEYAAFVRSLVSIMLEGNSLPLQPS